MCIICVEKEVKTMYISEKSKKMKNFTLKVVHKMTGYVSMLVPCIATSRKYLATQTTLGGNLVNASDNIITEIAAVYCGSLCWVIMGIDVLAMCFTKDEKMLKIERIALLTAIVAYILLKILSSGNGGSIGTTADELTEWLK